MKRAPLHRRRPPGRPARPWRRTPLIRGLTAPTDARAGTRPRAAIAASDAQREKIVGRRCVVCQQTRGITPAHVAPRSLGGCDDPDCVVPLCWPHRHAYETGRLELLAYLEPRWRIEVAHAVLHLGLISAYRHLTGRRVA